MTGLESLQQRRASSETDGARVPSTFTVGTRSVYASDTAPAADPDSPLVQALEDFQRLTKEERGFVLALFSPALETSSGATLSRAETSTESRIAQRVRFFTRALYAADDEVRRHISVDGRVLHGVPVIAGTRIPVYLIVSLVEEGYSIQQILQACTRLTEDQIKAALRYACEVLEDRA